MITMLPCFDNSEVAVCRCSPLTLLPTRKLPLTQALAAGRQVLGRQQLQQEMKHLMVPPGKNVPNLSHNRVVRAPPRSRTKAGPCILPTIPVTAKAPLDFAIFNKARKGILSPTLLDRVVTVLGRLFAGSNGEDNLKPTSHPQAAQAQLLKGLDK